MSGISVKCEEGRTTKPHIKPNATPKRPATGGHVRVDVDILLGPEEVRDLAVLHPLVEEALQGLDRLGLDLPLPS